LQTKADADVDNQNATWMLRWTDVERVATGLLRQQKDLSDRVTELEKTTDRIAALENQLQTLQAVVLAQSLPPAAIQDPPQEGASKDDAKELDSTRLPIQEQDGATSDSTTTSSLDAEAPTVWQSDEELHEKRVKVVVLARLVKTFVGAQVQSCGDDEAACCAELQELLEESQRESGLQTNPTNILFLATDHPATEPSTPKLTIILCRKQMRINQYLREVGRLCQTPKWSQHGTTCLIFLRTDLPDAAGSESVAGLSECYHDSWRDLAHKPQLVLELFIDLSTGGLRRDGSDSQHSLAANNAEQVQRLAIFLADWAQL